MMYLDTSVAIALFIPEVMTSSVKAWLVACPDPVVSSDWIVTDFASALSLKERRGDLTARVARSVWKEFVSFCGAGLRLVLVSRPAFEVAARMARDSANGLRSGDSLHLPVALEIGASSLASIDNVRTPDIAPRTPEIS